MNKIIILLLYVIICGYNYVDAIQTHMLLQLGVTEWNPIQNYMLSSFGFEGIVYFKIFWLLILGISLFLYMKE